MSKSEWVSVSDRINRIDVSAAMALRGATIVQPREEGPRRTYREDVVFGWKRGKPTITAAWVRATMRRHWLRTGKNPYKQNLIYWLPDMEMQRGLMPAESMAVRRVITSAAAMIASYPVTGQSRAHDELEAMGAKVIEVAPAAVDEADVQKAWPGPSLGEQEAGVAQGAGHGEHHLVAVFLIHVWAHLIPCPPLGEADANEGVVFVPAGARRSPNGWVSRQVRRLIDNLRHEGTDLCRKVPVLVHVLPHVLAFRVDAGVLLQLRERGVRGVGQLVDERVVYRVRKGFDRLGLADWQLRALAQECARRGVAVQLEEHDPPAVRWRCACPRHQLARIEHP